MFKNSIPQPTDNLSDSQADLLGNMQQLDTSFGVDHYAFSDLTANNGKHNKITTPLIVGGVHPTTSASELKFYAMQDLAAIGLLQYSRGVSDAPPSPVTYVQSPSVATVIPNNSSVTIIDLNGITSAAGTLFIYGTLPPSLFIQDCTFYFANNIFVLSNTSSSVVIGSAVGTALRISNGNPSLPANTFWSIKFHRIVV